ncbi:glutathione S-transferase theta-2B isoform X1 [Ictidomys tridecemlineatus]
MSGATRSLPVLLLQNTVSVFLAVIAVRANPAMGLELYLDLLSQPCRAVFIFAKKNGIPFQLRTVHILKGQNCSKEFLQINSLQKVPVLKDGDFILTESSAILIYLSCKYQVADHWYPSDLQTRSQIQEYLGWHAYNIRSIFGVTLWSRVLAPLIGIQVPEEKVKRNRTYMDHALQQLESKFLGDKPFLVGQQVSLADLMLLEELIQVGDRPVEQWLRAELFLLPLPQVRNNMDWGKPGFAQNHREGLWLYWDQNLTFCFLLGGVTLAVVRPWGSLH